MWYNLNFYVSIMRACYNSASCFSFVPESHGTFDNKGRVEFQEVCVEVFQVLALTTVSIFVRCNCNVMRNCIDVTYVPDCGNKIEHYSYFQAFSVSTACDVRTPEAYSFTRSRFSQVAIKSIGGWASPEFYSWMVDFIPIKSLFISLHFIILIASSSSLFYLILIHMGPLFKYAYNSMVYLFRMRREVK